MVAIPARRDLETADLHAPHGGHSRGATHSEDGEPTHVGPGTPRGDDMRRVWHPLTLSSELRGCCRFRDVARRVVEIRIEADLSRGEAGDSSGRPFSGCRVKDYVEFNVTTRTDGYG